jgi:hypothetical protein
LTSSARADEWVVFFDGFLDGVADSCCFVELGELLGLCEGDRVSPVDDEADVVGDDDEGDVVDEPAALSEALPCWQAASAVARVSAKTAAPDDAAARRLRDT